MNRMDPLPHLRLAKMLPETPVQCPVCKQNFKAIEGFAFLTFWLAIVLVGSANGSGIPTGAQMFTFFLGAGWALLLRVLYEQFRSRTPPQ